MREGKLALGTYVTFADPQVQHNNMVVDVNHAKLGNIKVGGIAIKLKETPLTVRRAPPALGEHTHELLQALGYDDDSIQTLRNESVVL